MSFGPRIGLALLVASAAVLAGCSTAPFGVIGSDAAIAAAEQQGTDLVPRLRPRAIAICYSSTLNDPEDVEAEALYLCDGGRLEKQDEDFFWNGCSLTQPRRINYICFPPDKAKRLN
jgi:hypothetical protein